MAIQYLDDEPEKSQIQYLDEEPTESKIQYLDEEPAESKVQYLDEVKADDDGNTAAEYAAGFATDIAISEGGRLGGATLGTAILPGVG